MTIKPSMRINRSDCEHAKIIKIFYIVWEMNYVGMKIQAIQWLFKLAPDWMTLDQAYTTVTMRELRDD